MNQISLVMATLGRVQEVEDFVRSIASQTYKNFELIIVDQNHDDRLVPVIDFAHDLGVKVNHISQAEPNQCLARNTGLMQAQGEIVAFPDDDCWYETDLLEKVLGRMNGQDTPECVVVRWVEQDPVGVKPHQLSTVLWRRFQEVQASCITLFFKRDLLLDMQGFDLSLGLHSWYGGSEETDLMFRVMAKDNKVVYLPEALVHHPINKLANLPLLKAFSQSRSRARGTGALYVKHKLEIWVILRGLVSPWFYAVRNLLKPVDAVVELGKAVGRLEGFIGWMAKKAS
jgi:glycosyltransferase involved in cell wall biosynthesis